MGILWSYIGVWEGERVSSAVVEPHMVSEVESGVADTAEHRHFTWSGYFLQPWLCNSQGLMDVISGNSLWSQFP